MHALPAFYVLGNTDIHITQLMILFKVLGGTREFRLYSLKARYFGLKQCFLMCCVWPGCAWLLAAGVDRRQLRVATQDSVTTVTRPPARHTGA